jgi:membrane-associated protein
MSYGKFASFNVMGGVAWVFSFLMLGYFFGGLPVVKNNFTLVIFGIIFVSILPPIIEFMKERMRTKSLK